LKKHVILEVSDDGNKVAEDGFTMLEKYLNSLK
jgi:hypothetical protein